MNQVNEPTVRKALMILREAYEVWSTINSGSGTTFELWLCVYADNARNRQRFLFEQEQEQAEGS